MRLVGEFLDELRDLGFSSLDKNASHYGLCLVLGNGEVSLLQLAGAYAALARGGDYLTPSPFPDARTGRSVIAPEAAWLVTSIISDETMRVQAFGENTPLEVGFPMAIKTGTSGDWRDSWTAGYTREFTIVVWSGDFGGSPMNQVSGSTGAGPPVQRDCSLDGGAPWQSALFARGTCRGQAVGGMCGIWRHSGALLSSADGSGGRGRFRAQAVRGTLSCSDRRKNRRACRRIHSGFVYLQAHFVRSPSRARTLAQAERKVQCASAL
ncbi:MAG TPA: penicillin-binding transpeptidase domain-containing protein [Spirochaetia bacterium]|nr:penicillin-binding transpeptidase domain-containing protein [Spirochaetia bacterium]